jgi:hypothetical protein
MIEESLLLLNEPWVSWMLGVTILAWGIVSWLIMKLKYLRPIQKNLNAATDLLNLYPDQELFAENFHSVDEQLGNNSLLGREWGLFKKNLLLPKGAGPVRATQNPEHFFPFEFLLTDFNDLRYYKFMPRYLTGTGALVSAIFLFTSLFFISKEFYLSDAARSQQVLGYFLSVVSFKFFPVLIGMFTGLLFSWSQRVNSAKQKNAIDSFRSLLKERIEVSTINEIPGLLGDTASFSQSINRVIQHLDSSMDGLKTKTVNEVIAAVESISTGIRQEKGSLDDLQGGSIDELLESVVAKVKTQVAHGHEELTQAAERLNKSTDSLDERFSTIIQVALGPVIASVKEEISNLAQNQEQNLRQSMGEMTLDSSEPGLAEHLLGAVKKDMDQLMVQQGKVIQDGLGAVTKQLRELLLSGGVSRKVDADTPASGLDIVDAIVDRLKGQAFIEPVIEVIRAEGLQFTKQNEETSREILNDAASKLHSQVEADTKKLRQTSERIDRSAANLEKNEQALRETLGEVTSQLRSQSGESTQENLLQAVLSEGTKTRKLLNEQPILEQVADALKSQSQQLAKSQSQALQAALGDVVVRGSDGELSLDPLLAAVKAGSENQLERQDAIIREALDGAVAGLKKSLSPDKLITAIQSETGRLAEKQNKISLDIAKINESVAPDLVIAAMQSQTKQMAQQQEALSNDIAKLGESIAPDGVVQAMQAESKQLDLSQKTLNDIIARVSESLAPDTIIAAIKTQTKQLNTKQESLSRDIAELSEVLAPDNLIEEMKAQTTQLVDTVSGISMEPVLEALKTQSDHLAHSQSQTLYKALSDVAVKGSDGEVAIDPILAAVKAESERQLEGQDSVIRKALDGAVAGLNKSLSPDNIIAAMKDQTAHLTKKQDALRRDIAGLNESLSPDSVIEAIQAQTTHMGKKQDALSRSIAELGDSISQDSVIEAIQTQSIHVGKKQDTLSREIAELGDSISQEGIIDAIRSQVGTLVDRISSISMEPVLDALQAQSEQLTTSQSQALQIALGDIAVQGGEGEIAIDPLLAAVKAEGVRQLENHGAVIREAMDGAVAKLGESFSTQSVLAAIQDQTSNINKKQAALSQNITGLSASLSPDSLIDTVRTESRRLAKSQESLHSIVAGIGEATPQDAIIVKIKSHMDTLVDRVSSISMQPVIDALNSQSKQLATSQSQSLQKALMDIAVQGSDGEVAIDPLLAAVKAESERQLENHDNVIRQALDGVVVELNKSLSPEGIIAAIQDQTSSINQKQDALAQDIAGLGSAIDPDSIIDTVRTESKRLSKSQDSLNAIVVDLGESISQDGVITAIDRLSERQDFLSQNIADLNQPISTDSVIAAIKIETAQFAKSHKQSIDELKAHNTKLANIQNSDMHSALSDVVNNLNEALSLDGMIDVLQNGTEQLIESQKQLIHDELSGLSVEPILEALNSQSLDLAENQKQAVYEAMGDISVQGSDGGMSIEPLLATMRAENTRQLEQQETVIRDVLGDVLSSLADIKGDTHNLSEQVGSGGGSNELFMESVVDIVQAESQRVIANQDVKIRELMDQVKLGDAESGEGIYPMVSAIRDELAQLTGVQENAIREAFANISLETAELISMEPLIAEVQSQTSTLAHTLQQTIHDTMVNSESGSMDEKSLDPVLEAIRLQGEQLAVNQGRVMQDILAEVNIPQAGNEPVLETILSAIVGTIKGESERVLGQQSEIVREALGNVVSSIDDLFSTDTVTNAVKLESNRILERLDEGQRADNLSLETILESISDQGDQLVDSQIRALQETLSNSGMQGGGDGVAGMEAVVTAMQLEGERLLQKQSETVRTTMLAAAMDISNGSLAPDSLVETLQMEMGRLAELIEKRNVSDETDIGPVVAAIQKESAELSENLGSILHTVIQDAIERDNGREVSLEPVLAEIQDSGNRILERLETSSVSQDLTQILRSENEQLLERLTQQATMGPIIDALQSQGDIIASKQAESLRSTVSEILATGGDPLALQRVVEAVKQEGSNIVEQLAEKFSMAPILKSMEKHIERTTFDQFQTLYKTLEDVSARHASEPMNLEPIIASVKAEGAKVTEGISELLSGTTILDAIRTEMYGNIKSQSVQLEDTLAKITQETGEDFDLEPLITAMHSQTQRLTEELAEKVDMEPVLAAVKKENARLVARQSELLDKITAQADQEVDLQPILSAMQSESRRLYQELSEQISNNQTVDLQPMLEAMQVESRRLHQELGEQISADKNVNLHPLLSAMHNESKRLHQELSEKISAGKDIDLQPILSTMQNESRHLHQELSKQISSGKDIDLQPIFSTMQDESRRLHRELSEQISSSKNVDLQPILSTMQNESHRQTQELSRKISLEPVLATIKDETAQVIQNQSESLRQALVQMAQEASHELDMKPILSAIQAESRRLSQELSGHSLTDNRDQTETLKQVIADAVNTLRKDLTPEGLLDVVKTETNRIASTLENVVIPKIDTPRRAAPEPLSQEMVRSAVKSETSRLETLLNKNLQAATAVEQKPKPAPIPVKPAPIPAKPAPAPLPVKPAPAQVQAQPKPSKKKLGWALTKPGEQYSDHVDGAAPARSKKAAPEIAPQKAVQEINWEPIAHGQQAETPYNMPKPSKQEAISELQVLMTHITPQTVAGIDGKSLLELMKSMKEYLTDQFGEQSDYLNASIQDLIVGIQSGLPISDPKIITLLREIGDRSNLIMASYNPDIPRVANLDKGFLKTAKELQKQVDDLSFAKHDTKSMRSDTLSNSLDPNNFRQKIFHQFADKKPSVKSDKTRTQRLSSIGSVAAQDNILTAQVEKVTTAPVEKVTTAPVEKVTKTPVEKVTTAPVENLEQKPAKQELMWNSPVALAPTPLETLETNSDTAQATTQAATRTRISSKTMEDSDKWHLPSISHTKSTSPKTKDSFFSSFLKKRRSSKDNKSR